MTIIHLDNENEMFIHCTVTTEFLLSIVNETRFMAVQCYGEVSCNDLYYWIKLQNYVIALFERLKLSVRHRMWNWAFRSRLRHIDIYICFEHQSDSLWLCSIWAIDLMTGPQFLKSKQKVNGVNIMCTKHEIWNMGFDVSVIIHNPNKSSIFNSNVHGKYYTILSVDHVLKLATDAENWLTFWLIAHFLLLLLLYSPSPVHVFKLCGISFEHDYWLHATFMAWHWINEWNRYLSHLGAMRIGCNTPFSRIKTSIYFVTKRHY